MVTLQKPTLHANWIEPEARAVVDRLQKAGFQTYLVGGCVRDLLAGIHPKDYDIATSAHPEQVRKIIRGSYIIGKRFQLVLVKRGIHQFEVATFRRNALPEEIEASERSFADNFFGTPQEDAQRRDFTINGLFYDPIRDELIDYVGGRQDIESGLIRMIGDPDYRLKEDPIRILRAIRLSHKLRFSIEETLRSAIEKNSQELVRSILPRKREEYFKLLRLSDPSLVFQELY
ncbi:MAG: poly(A) polymerase, partial [Pseudomonadota bacterium]